MVLSPCGCPGPLRLPIARCMRLRGSFAYSGRPGMGSQELPYLCLALPLTPAIAIAHKDCVRGVNVGPGIEGRVARIWRAAPGAGIQDLEDTRGMARRVISAR